MLRELKHTYTYEPIDWMYFNDKGESRAYTGEITKMYKYIDKKGKTRYGLLFQDGTATTLLMKENEYYQYLGEIETFKKHGELNAIIQGIPHYCNIRNRIVIDRSVLVGMWQEKEILNKSHKISHIV